MYFKPKIFISSVLSFKTVRTNIKDELEMSGAEVILYEKDLTPSISASTYRQDILDADFVIFILDNKYGNKTETGKSGTHEEWDIANKHKILSHVYLKQVVEEENETESKEFVENEIINRNVSFYYYIDENDLLKRIRGSTFTIAKEIVLNRINIGSIEDKKLKRLAFEKDIEDVLFFLRSYDEVRVHPYYRDFSLDTVRTFFFSFQSAFIDRNKPFIDPVLNDKLKNVLLKVDNFCNYHSKIYTTAGQFGKRYINLTSINQKIALNSLSSNAKILPKNGTELRKLFTEIDKSVKILESYYIQKRKELDIVL